MNKADGKVWQTETGTSRRNVTGNWTGKLELINTTGPHLQYISIGHKYKKLAMEDCEEKAKLLGWEVKWQKTTKHPQMNCPVRQVCLKRRGSYECPKRI